MEQEPVSHQWKFIGMAIGVYALILVFLLVIVFPGLWTVPQSVRIGSFSMRWYGICLALAAGAAYWLAWQRRSRYGISQHAAETIFLVMIALGFVGARLYHVATALNYYAVQPGQILAVWNGGLSIFGAMIGAILGLWAYKKFAEQELSLFNVLDWLAPSVALGQAIGRFGNLFNYEAYGYPTNLPWAMFVPPQFRQAPFELAKYFHPLFIYESIGALVIAFFLLTLRRKLASGSLFLLWLFLYNGMRIFTEALRIDSTFIGEIRLNMIVAVILTITAAVGLYYLNVYKNSHHS